MSDSINTINVGGVDKLLEDTQGRANLATEAARLDARIDNIITSPAPSGEEIIDARLGENGVTQASLGEAIRIQIGDVKAPMTNTVFAVGKGNVYTGDYEYDIIKPGHHYRVNVISWDKTNISSSASAYYLRIAYKEREAEGDGTELVAIRTNSDLDAYYDILIPDTTTDPVLLVGGRVTTGKTGILNVIDTTYERYTENLISMADYIEVIGKGNTYTSKRTDIPLIPGNHYRVYIDKWEHSEVPQSTSAALFEAMYVLNGVETTIQLWSTAREVPDYFDFIMPSNITGSVFAVGGRLNETSSGIVRLEDRTIYDITENLQNGSTLTYVNGTGNIYARSMVDDPIIPGHFYKLHLRYWPHETIPTVGSGILFECGYLLNGDETTLRRRYQSQSLEDEYIVWIPDDLSDFELFIGGRIDSGKTAVVDIEDCTEVLPAYVETMIESMNSALMSHQTSNSVSFPFITDIHVGNTNMNTSVLWEMLMTKEAINRIAKKNPLELCIFNGDYLNNSTTTSKATVLSWYDHFNDAIEGLDIINWRGKGNHDINDIATDDAQHMTDEEYYKHFMKHMDISRFVMPYGDLIKDYGYYDDKNRKIRFIFINTVDVPSGYKEQHVTGISNSQLNFIANALKFTEPDWGVVFVSHHTLQYNSAINPDQTEMDYLAPAHGGTPLLGVIDAFRNKTTYTYTSSTQNWEYSVNVDYTNNESNEVIAMFSGHTHADRMTKVNGYVMLSSAAAGSSVPSYDSNGNQIERTLYTATETSWDIITIDRKNKMIYADRFGAGDSRSITYGV